MTDGKNVITVIENKYGHVMFRMGLTHLVDVGVRHLTDEVVEDCIRQITADEEANKANGVITVMTPKFQCGIVRCAAELAKISIWDLFAYIKENVHIGAEPGTNKPEAGNCPKCGSAELEYDGFIVEESECFYKWTCRECGARGQDCYDKIFRESIIDGNK